MCTSLISLLHHQQINARYSVEIVNQTYPAYSVSPVTDFTGKGSVFLQIDNPVYLDYDIPQYRKQVVVVS